MQPNFINDSARTFIHTKQANTHTHTTRTTKATTSAWLALVTQSLCSYNWDGANSAVFIFKLRKKLANLCISSITSFVRFILYASSIPKNLHLVCWAISYISPITTWIRYQFNFVILELILRSMVSKTSCKTEDKFHWVAPLTFEITLFDWGMKAYFTVKLASDIFMFYD